MAEPGRTMVEAYLPTPTVNDPSDELVVRAATAGDATHIHGLIMENVVAGHLLARPLVEVQQHVPRFLIAAADDHVVGCGELARLSQTVAEVRSLVVASTRRGSGIGRRLLVALIDEATRRGIPTMCAFTHQARPFVKAGFSIVPHPWVPDKIATDCHRCEWFRRCGQYAVLLHVSEATRRATTR